MSENWPCAIVAPGHGHRPNSGGAEPGRMWICAPAISVGTTPRRCLHVEERVARKGGHAAEVVARDHLDPECVGHGSVASRCPWAVRSSPTSRDRQEGRSNRGPPVISGPGRPVLWSCPSQVVDRGRNRAPRRSCREHQELRSGSSGITGATLGTRSR